MACLSDDRVRELYDFNRKVIAKRGAAIKLNGEIPFLTQTSELHWYPSVELVCCSPIGEDVDTGWGIDRPIFYTEINAMGVNIIKKRFRVRHKRIIQLINSE
ncbi:MAG TPA: hypothetical protein VLS94_04105 [Fusibacter sp.]|nr:hypothetical protein [Fusibacter sp.]